MALHNELGKRGEALAKEYIQQQGFTILHNNWKYNCYEIDLIAMKAGKLHFVEVKTRKSSLFGYPEESVTKKKFTRLQKAAAQFLYKHPQWTLVQYDILSIFIDGNDKADYFYIEDVYI
jgi:putative endonuclease